MSIPNLLKSAPHDKTFEPFLNPIYEYRKNRYSLHRDEKVLTSQNSLMIAAMCDLYRISKKKIYISAAQNANGFIKKYLYENGTLYVSFHMGKRGVRAFLDDYAAYIYAQLSLYRATLEHEYLNCAKKLSDKVISDFGDNTGGFYLYGKDHEELILRPKETYDGAIPSGNSLMAYNLVRLSLITEEEKYEVAAQRQLDFLGTSAEKYPASHSMFLIALLDYKEPLTKITVIFDEMTDKSSLPLALPHDAIIHVLNGPTNNYTLKNGKTTYYVCRNHSCQPPTNHLQEIN